MAETITEQNVLKQTYEANMRQLRTLLDAQARLLRYTEKTAIETRAEIERVAEALSPGLVDEFRKKNPAGLSPMTARAIADVVIHDVQRRLLRLNAAAASGQNVGELYERASADLARLQEEKAQWAERLAAKGQRIQQIELRLAVLQQSLEDTQRRLGPSDAPPTKTVDSTPLQPVLALARLPEWVQKWHSQQTYERDLALLRVLAETGVARRKDAAELVEAQLGVDPRAGSVARLFLRCQRMGLIELIEGKTEVPGQATHLVRLTEKGRDACRLLLGREPVPSQATELLKRHHSAAHTLLTLEAADMLRGAGYEVDLFPAQINLPGEPAGRIFAPSLIASRQGRTLYVQVERDTHENPEAQAHKWRNTYDATDGEFYIIVPNQSALKAIKGEILFWAGQRRLVLWMSSISDVKSKRGEEIWLLKRGQPTQPAGRVARK